MRRLLLHVPWVLLAGCYVYSPRSYVDGGAPFAGVRVPLDGCLDVAVGYADDPSARGQVVEYSFGNHCFHRVEVDLASVRAVSYRADESYRPLVAYDPRRELRPLSIEALWAGHERIEYVPAVADASATGSTVCVDVGGIDRSAARTTRWVCAGAAVMQALPAGGPS